MQVTESILLLGVAAMAYIQFLESHLAAAQDLVVGLPGKQILVDF